MDVVRADTGLEHGVALPVWDALLRGEADDLATLAQKASAGSVTFRLPEGRDATRAQAASRRQVARLLDGFQAQGARVRGPADPRRRGGSVVVDFDGAEQVTAELIARGYTYKEVGKALFISVKTVETHVSAVLRKLQLSNRHELTRWATARRLV